MKPSIKKASVSFRIGTKQWLREERFSELLSLFEKYKGVTDELTLFNADTHALIKLELMADRCKLLSERIGMARKHGYRAGIRESESGKYCVPMINTCSDTAEYLTLALRTAAESIRVFDMDCKETVISSCKSDGSYKKFILSPLGAWQMCMVMASN